MALYECEVCGKKIQSTEPPEGWDKVERHAVPDDLQHGIGVREHDTGREPSVVELDLFG